MTSSPALASNASDPRASTQSTELSDQLPVSSNTSTTTFSPTVDPAKLGLCIWFINSCSKKLLDKSNSLMYSAWWAHQELFKRLIKLLAAACNASPRWRAAREQKMPELTSKASAGWNRFDPVRYVSMGAKEFPLYPETRGDWDNIDLLMPSSPEDEDQRYTAVWHWIPKTCAVDAIICLAVHLNANRIQADQFDASGTRTLGTHWLRTIARLPWGRMTKKQRGKLRDALQKRVAEASATYKDIGADRPLDETYLFVFKDLPQVNSLLVKRWRCDCESSTWAYSNLTQIPSFQATAHAKHKNAEPRTISELLQSAFNSVQESNAPKNCCPGGGCEEFKKEYLIVGRLAPTIALFVSRDDLGPILWDDEPLIEISFQHWNPDDDANGAAGPVERKAQYRLEAVIYHETPPHGSDHYYVESRLHSEKTDGRRHMDMHNARVTKSSCVSEGSWEISTAKPALLVFRIVIGNGISER